MMNVNGVVNVKSVEVMMVKKEVVNGKEVKRIKMLELNENVDDLWYKWDEFINCWKKRRKEYVEKLKKIA